LVNRDTKQAKAFVVENADKECLLPRIGCNVKEKSITIKSAALLLPIASKVWTGKKEMLNLQALPQKKSYLRY
jgi:hypothetical protein